MSVILFSPLCFSMSSKSSTINLHGTFETHTPTSKIRLFSQVLSFDPIHTVLILPSAPPHTNKDLELDPFCVPKTKHSSHPLYIVFYQYPIFWTPLALSF